MMTFTTVRINVNASCQTLHQTEIGIIIAAEMVRYKRMATNGVKISTMLMKLLATMVTLMTTMAVTLMTTMVVTPTTTTMGTTQLKSKKFKKRKREI